MCKHICECHFPNLSLNAPHLMDNICCNWAGTRGAPLQFLLVRSYLLYPSLLTLKNTMQCLISVVFLFSVAPICYAHLAAAQMSQFMKFDEFAEPSSGSGVHSSTSTAIPELPRLHSQVCSSMFFCWGVCLTLCAVGLTLSVEKSAIMLLVNSAGWLFVKSLLGCYCFISRYLLSCTG
jgi:hypothetical protein